MGEGIGILDLDLISAVFEGDLTISGFSAEVSPVRSNTTSKPSPLPCKSDPFHVLGGVNMSRWFSLFRRLTCLYSSNVWGVLRCLTKVLSRYLMISSNKMADGTYVDGGETENLSAGDQSPIWPGLTYLDERTIVSYDHPKSSSLQMHEVYRPLSGNLQVVELKSSFHL